jgi:UDP-N-acetylmuramoyl-L-alanyl-D-glutamate--2,6-diaminopimelate ligase
MVFDLCVDSRFVTQGTLFAAMAGTRTHGANFVPKVLDAGAVAILTDPAGAALCADDVDRAGAALIVVDDPRDALAMTSALWFGAQPATAVAITGTNGKTSVATFLRQIWEQLGHAAINLGTTGVEGAWTAPLSHTTPEPITLHRTLAGAAAAGVTHVAMEASSHGLDQRRLDGVTLTAAGFTNFTQDHLDYHSDFAEYFAAKAGLFRRVLSDEGVAVINVDDPRGIEMQAIAIARGQEVLTVGQGMGDLNLLAHRVDGTGQDLRFAWHGAVHMARLNLVGDFQAQNVMLACALAIGCGAKPDDVFATIPTLTTVRGRMQLAATRQNGASVFVDYAHTPDAVEKALAALRPHVLGRIIAVVGAGGDRDGTKRPLMGAAAAYGADQVIVTDDNPRSEDPGAIRAAVLAGAHEAGGGTALEFGDRAEAILRAVDMLTAGDALLIAGKGHETGQIVGDTTLPFDDVEQASMAVSVLDGGTA